MQLFPTNCSCIIHGGQRLFFSFLGHSRRPNWTEACHRIFNLVCVCITEIPSVRICISILMQKDSVHLSTCMRFVGSYLTHYLV